MLGFSLLNATKVKKVLQKRAGELKFGETIEIPGPQDTVKSILTKSHAKYVLFGIPEFAGVFGNYGNSGTQTTWNIVLKTLINIQSNLHTIPNSLLILGHIDCNAINETINTLDQSKKSHINKSRKLVEDIDKTVTHIVYTIVSSGKIPIIIGGGHNNAYGNIKGTALALNTSINVINFDAHTDFRALEGRHSGNGFSYAKNESFLKRYFMFGLHENYTSSSIFETLNASKQLQYNTFESVMVRKELSFNSEIKRAGKFICKSPFGIEIDCDAIEAVKSSAQTPSGFSVTKTRQFIHYFGSIKNATYLHICEAIATKNDKHKIGKLISYLITDFMRANNN